MATAAKPVGAWIPEVWARFLLAIVGLGIAFCAALFSNVARESGSLWVTVALAAVALLLAVLVGLTTVPYLARRVAGNRLKDAFHYEVTRVGIFYVVAVVVIAVAAMNTGNNLLYIIVAAMLAAIVVSGFASAAVLRALELDVRLPQRVFARQKVAAGVALRNARRALPAYSVSVVPLARPRPARRWQWIPTTFSFPPGRRSGKSWITLPDRRLGRVKEAALAPEILQGGVYFPYLPAKSHCQAQVELSFERRGRHSQDTFGLRTRFPFAFLAKTRRVALSRELIVFPSIVPTEEFYEVLPLINGEYEAFVRGRGNDLYRIREYLPEDSARHVDWKASAKSGALMVREFAREDERKLRLVFDVPQRNALSDAAFEKAVSLAASLAMHFSGENAQLSFLAPKYNGSADLYEFLTYLALVQAGAGPSPIESLSLTDELNIVLTARPRGTLPAVLLASSYVVFLGEKTPASTPSPPFQDKIQGKH
jgi:uncharacterized protein (DUF58 family)